MNMDFGALLGRAWKVTWQHKVLWIFGILAALSSGGPNFNFQFGRRDFNFGAPGGPNLPPRVQQFFDQAGPGLLWAIAIGIFCVVVLIGLVFLVLSVIGRGGLIDGVRLAEANNKVTFGEAWGSGLKNFWRLVFIQLVVGVVAFVVSLMSIFAFLTICLIPLACVGFIVVWGLGVIAYFAQIAAVLENLQLMDALRRAWQMIQANLGPIIILGIVLAVVAGIAGFVLALPFIAIVLPAVASQLAENVQVQRVSLALALICGVAYLPVLILLAGVLQTWVTSVWVLAYQQFTRPAAAAVPVAA